MRLDDKGSADWPLEVASAGRAASRLGQRTLVGVMAEPTKRDHSESPSPIAGGDSKTVDTDQPPMGDLLRMFWLLAGNIGLAILGALISKQAPWTFSTLDGLFWGLVVALLAARYFDITRFGGLTASNEPANTGHWVRYAIKLVVISALLWVGAQCVAL